MSQLMGVGWGEGSCLKSRGPSGKGQAQTSHPNNPVSERTPTHRETSHPLHPFWKSGAALPNSDHPLEHGWCGVPACGVLTCVHLGFLSGV